MNIIVALIKTGMEEKNTKNQILHFIAEICVYIFSGQVSIFSCGLVIKENKVSNRKHQN